MLRLLTALFASLLTVSIASANFELQIGERNWYGFDQTLLLPAISGNAFAFAQNLQITQPIGDDSFVAGETITIAAPIAGDLHAVGKTITINADIAGTALLFANSVTINPDVTISDEVYIYAQQVTLFGQLGDNAQINAPLVTFKDGSKINGDLQLTTLTAPTDSETVVTGETTLTLLAADDATDSPLQYLFDQLIGSIWWLLTVALVGAILLKLAPRAIASIARSGRQQTLVNLGIGCLLLVLLPITLIILLISIVGILPAVALSLLTATAVIFATLIKGVIVGHWLTPLSKKPTFLEALGGLMLGSVVVALLGAVPLFGGVVSFVLTLIALGAVIQLSWALRK